jgi:hypothetical protein
MYLYCKNFYLLSLGILFFIFPLCSISMRRVNHSIIKPFVKHSLTRTYQSVLSNNFNNTLYNFIEYASKNRACESYIAGHIKVLQEKEGNNLLNNCPLMQSDSPLHNAARKGLDKIVGTLLNSFAIQGNLLRSNGNSILHDVCIEDYTNEESANNIINLIHFHTTRYTQEINHNKEYLINLISISENTVSAKSGTLFDMALKNKHFTHHRNGNKQTALETIPYCAVKYLLKWDPSLLNAAYYTLGVWRKPQRNVYLLLETNTLNHYLSATTLTQQPRGIFNTISMIPLYTEINKKNPNLLKVKALYQAHKSIEDPYACAKIHGEVQHIIEYAQMSKRLSFETAQRVRDLLEISAVTYS